MENKKWDILGTVRFFIGIILVVALFYSCSNQDKARQEEKLHYQYQQGYDQGYYDGANGIEYYNP